MVASTCSDKMDMVIITGSGFEVIKWFYPQRSLALATDHNIPGTKTDRRSTWILLDSYK